MLRKASSQASNFYGARHVSIGCVYWDVNVVGLSSPRFAPRKLFCNEPSNAHHKLLTLVICLLDLVIMDA